jgi:two-component system chemotaxis response regulator CheB
MKRRPVPIVLVTAAGQDQEQVVEAMENGAIDFVMKPTHRATEQIYSLADDLPEKVITAAGARVNMLVPREAVLPPEALMVPARPPTGKIQAVVIGISTGGPQALRNILPCFSKDLPVPIAIVLHMPVGYTGPFAHRLNEICEIEVLEAEEGLEMKPGRAILAQAGRHMTFRREQNGLVSVHLSLHPDQHIHRPAVDVLFQSAAEVYGEHTLGIVMTGMGDDGTLGAAWIKAQGGLIFTEAEESCVVYGMPRSVVEAGLSDKIVRLMELPKQIQEIL